MGTEVDRFDPTCWGGGGGKEAEFPKTRLVVEGLVGILDTSPVGCLVQWATMLEEANDWDAEENCTLG